MKKWKDELERWIHQLQFTKKERYTIFLVLIGTVVGMLLILFLDNQPLSGYLYRNILGEGDREEILRVELESDEYRGEFFDIEISISEETYTDLELEQAFLEGIETLDELILGENESLDQVYNSLNLVSEIPGTGLEVEWTWSPYEVLNIYGEIQEEYVGEGIIVELTGTLSYEDEKVDYIRSIKVLPREKTSIEVLLEEISVQIEAADLETRTEPQFMLPMEVDGVELAWYTGISYRGLGILLLGIGIILCLVWKKEAEQRKIREDKKEQLLRDYPQLIHTFALYIGAGMAAKNAWKRIVQEHDETRYLYREMKQTYLEMRNGFSELETYERFGRRCDLRCYQRFGLLLSQNVRKGTKGLIELLEREAMEAFEEQRNRIKQDGEKAGTKLLMPMFLMLVVVLAIVIVPAFFSIQI